MNTDRKLQRMLKSVDHTPTPMVGTLECGHTIALDWTMTQLSRWRNGSHLMQHCEACAAIPRPATRGPAE